MYYWSVLRNIGMEISKTGHQVFILPELGNNNLGIKKSAEIIEKSIRQKGLRHSVIIGFSKGGPVGKQIMLDFEYSGDKDLVDYMFAINAPFSGTGITRIIPFRSFRNFTPGNRELRNLNADTRVNSKIVSVFSQWDNLITRGSYLEGAENVEFPDKGHHAILYDDRLIWFINIRMELRELEKQQK
jgi:hypothetical protein